MNDLRMMSVLLAPHVSEKSTRIGDASNQVVFRVRSDARKPEIRRAVEKMFKVEVMHVQVLNVKGKRKGVQRRAGKRAAGKKAYVRLTPGPGIDLLGGA